MPSYIRQFVASIISLLLTETTFASEDPTAFEYLKRQQTAQFDIIVQYCRENAPEANQLMNEGYTNFISSLEQGLAIWVSEKPGMKQTLLKKLPSNSEERKELEQKMQEIQDIAKQSLESIKKHNPHTYCPLVANRLKASTPATVLKSLHAYDELVAAELRKKK